ncbi:MAG: DUF255 domain-containing protein [Desulfobulbaceae bacterium]|nr:DUF255 domain-containing protein [Desulfobulbaceae bacterium]
MGEKPNSLINEKSPYLLQHAFNPVAWHPWSKDALALAGKEDKPIFLSIGYSTCHWCHVMAHESFEDPEIAALLNKWFICIKVDREERPDIDQMYMAATQAMTGSGGWPMSVFLFPDGRPFYAATYIPPKTQYGRPGFPDVLEAVHKAWTDRREDLSGTAGKLLEALQDSNGNAATRINSDIQKRAFQLLAETYDDKYGGFGDAPKFPRPVVFNFLLRYWHDEKEQKALDMTLSTLRAMAGGGMYDQLGGGFHRYSVDAQWRVPHFEKMLYDQSQLVNSYLDAFQITEDAQYAGIAEEIFDYVLRDMHDQEGGFYSAEDADSDDPYEKGKHGEGAFFLWTEKDIVQTLSARAADIFNFCYGVEFDGNALNDPQQEFIGRNILYLYIQHTSQEAAAHFNMDSAEIEQRLSQSKKILFEKRELRTRPHLDDKVITAWNGLMIGALARGGAILNRPKYIDAAKQAARFIHGKLYDQENGRLYRRYRDGEAGIAGQLDDYAFLAAGLIDLYQVVHEPEWLQWAVALTEQQIKLFRDDRHGGFFDSVADNTIPVRMKGDYDGAEPAANSIAAMNLLKLGMLTGNGEWKEMAVKTIDVFSSRINTYPPALLQMLCVLDQTQEKPRQVVVAGDPDRADTKKMLAAVSKIFDPGRMVLFADGGKNQKFLAQNLDFMKTVSMQNNQATAYVCRDFTCRLPITDVQELKNNLIGK